MKLLKVKSIGINPGCDIVDLIPRNELQRNLDSLIGAIDKLDEVAGSDGTVCDPYRTDSYNGCSGDSEIPYANYVHSTPGHKCWLYDQSGMMTTAMPINSPGSPDLKNATFNQYNEQVLYFTVEALIAKKYFKPNTPSERKDVFSILKILLPYIGRGVEGVFYMTEIQQVRQNHYSPTLKNVVGWNNCMYIQISSSMDASEKLKLTSKLSNCHFSIGAKWGTGEEVQEALYENTDRLRTHIVPFMFRCGIDADGSQVLTFAKYRNYDVDQAVIRVTSTTKIRTNIPSNIEMLVNKGNSFSFEVSVSKPNSLYNITINDTHYTLNSYGLVALAEIGVSITEKDSTQSMYNNFSITVGKVTSNMDIHLSDIPIATELISQKLFSVLNSKPEDKPSILLSVPALNGPTTEGIIQFKFAGSVDENLINRAKVYIVPIELYDGTDDVYGDVFTETEHEVSFINVGFNDDKICQVHFSVSDGAIGHTFLVRVIFPEKSMVCAANFGRNQVAPVKYFSPKLTIQFEISKATDEIVSISESVKMPYGVWAPSIPLPLLTTRFKLSNVDLYPWYELVDSFEGEILTTKKAGLPNTYTLIKNEGYAGDIPNLVPESSIYQPMLTYKTMNKDEYVEIPDNAKFAMFSIPIGLFLPYYYNNGDQITISSMRVNSGIPVKFSNMDCDDAAYFLYNIDNERSEGVIYNVLRRPYINGYIDIPVLFLDKDVVIIDFVMDNWDGSIRKITYRIDVDLPESVTEPDEGFESEGGEESGSGDSSDTPIEGEETTGDEPSESNPDDEDTGDGTGNETPGETTDPDSGNNDSDTTEEGGTTEETPSDNEDDSQITDPDSTNGGNDTTTEESKESGDTV